ncbi:acetyl-CoA C-acyltransferase [Nesterenkonia natronophila]|uniref:Probable acetyl-CoA acetyltransferase n=1 Tax=Nesterenkonia natronophila TaxID=2174932 RepID=A0A3A4FDF7_9MICC|nr:acetyl-CoA C-acyltransferase [Nesterenkonia natronophila]RJN32824.1 acetyl-CoA C-acyltransferase [Nesterenkonia natronophila]
MTDAFLVSGTRTPVGRYGGALSTVRPDDLAALVIRQVVKDSKVPSAEVDEVILGNSNGAGEENRNVARMAWLLAGFEDTVPGITVNRLCASGLSAIAQAQQMIAAGAADLVVAGGVESMSRAPWVMAKPEKAFGRPGEVVDSSIGWRFVNAKHLEHPKRTFSMPETAEEVARVDEISREDADEFALRSHQRAVAATEAGRLTREITPVEVPGRRGKTTTVTQDEGPRPETTLDILSGLRPVVAGGSVVTAGNSSSLNDGASAVLVASAAAVEKYGLQPRARVVGSANAGVPPEIMGIGPVPATQKVLERTGWSIDDLDAVELNEAFASQSLACVRRLGLDQGIVNTDGGAIALGHPLGSSGSRLVLTLLRRLEDDGLRRGLATMCVGVGQGSAMLIERV